MRFLAALAAALLLNLFASAQPAPKAVTVPITLDHNRVIIDVNLPLPGGQTKRMRGWVDNGNQLWMSPRTAAIFGPVDCPAHTCTATPPPALSIGGLEISLSDAKTAYSPAGFPKDVMVPGMGAEITLPSIVLHHYDVVIDYPNRQLTLAPSGALRFEGTAVPLSPVLAAPWLPALPVGVAGKRYMFGLDLGASVSFVSDDLFAMWIKTHPDWSHLSASVGPASSDLDVRDEAVLRIPSLTLGQVELKGVLAATHRTEMFETGVLGADALLDFRVGLDYANSRLYFKRLSSYEPAGIDVVGFALRAEPDGRYTVTGVADYDGKPSVPAVKAGDILLGVDGAPATGATMGQVWSLLGGTPGQTRTLTLEREGKRFAVDAPVRRFLPLSPAAPAKSPRRNPHRRN